MQSIGVRKLKAHPRRVLRKLRKQGEAVEVTIRGRVVARLVPVEAVVASPVEAVVASPVEPVVASPVEPVVASPVEPVVASPVEPVVATVDETSAVWTELHELGAQIGASWRANTSAAEPGPTRDATVDPWLEHLRARGAQERSDQP
jgi:antitoxin (DNA-binding transcriptional repressor) of toxin-antitoxin stability system